MCVCVRAVLYDKALLRPADDYDDDDGATTTTTTATTTTTTPGGVASWICIHLGRWSKSRSARTPFAHWSAREEERWVYIYIYIPLYNKINTKGRIARAVGGAPRVGLSLFTPTRWAAGPGRRDRWTGTAAVERAIICLN